MQLKFCLSVSTLWVLPVGRWWISLYWNTLYHHHPLQAAPAWTCPGALQPPPFQGTFCGGAFGVMKARWRATFFKALEVSPAFAPDIAACCAFLHNLCLTTNDIIKLEEHLIPDSDHQGLLQHPPGGLETSGRNIRNRMAATVSAPELLPQHLQEHDYISAPTHFFMGVIFCCSFIASHYFNLDKTN